MRHLSVAICTYNGAQRVPEVLDRLRAQDVEKDLTWEVIVVDNNSSDETAEVVRRSRELWRADVPLRYALESRQGLAYARQRAIDEANGEWVAFLDDDNLPRSDWVQEAVRFAQEHDRAGSFGGRLIGEYEIEPPPSFGVVQGLFAINEREEKYCYSTDAKGEFPPGAGMVVRRSAWLAHVPRELQNAGVVGSSRIGVGEDLEAQWYLHAAGWEVWHNPEMVCMHKIPASRFSEPYLARFFEGIAASRCSTRRLRYGQWQWPMMALVFWFNDARMLIGHLLRYRRMLTDPFVKGKIQVLLHLLRSPFTLNEQL